MNEQELWDKYTEPSWFGKLSIEERRQLIFAMMFFIFVVGVGLLVATYVDAVGILVRGERGMITMSDFFFGLIPILVAIMGFLFFWLFINIQVIPWVKKHLYKKSEVE